MEVVTKLVSEATTMKSDFLNDTSSFPTDALHSEGAMSTAVAALMTTDASSVEATEAELLADWYYYLADTIFVSVMPVIMVVGLVGNVLSLAVITRPELRRSPMSVFIAALAVADTVVLIMDFLNNWLKMVPKVYLLGNLHFCKFHRWFFDVVYTYAAWLVMCLAVERLIVVWYPMKAKVICTRRGAVIAVTTLPFIIGLMYLYSLWAWILDDNGMCNVQDKFAFFMWQIHPYLTAVMYSYMPAAVLIFCTVGIMIQLKRMRERRAKMASQHSDTEYKVAITVVTVSVCFFILTLPLTMYYILIFNLGQYVYTGPEMALVETFILIIGLSNNAINFFLYVLTSAKFCTELKKMMSACWGSPDESSQGTSDMERKAGLKMADSSTSGRMNSMSNTKQSCLTSDSGNSSVGSSSQMDVSTFAQEVPSPEAENTTPPPTSSSSPKILNTLEGVESETVHM